MRHSNNDSTVNRRDFLATSATAGSLLLALGAEEVRAQTAASAAPPSPVNCAVIGLGRQGREILAALGRVPGANLVAISDPYQPFLNRSKQAAPKAAALPDARLVLDRSDVKAIFIATPTHRHKDLVLAALQAGKHVYCEAPLAHTVADARAIAQAAKSSKQLFQAGLQNRSNPQHLHVQKFVRGGVLGSTIQARGQWHKKTSWRQVAPNPQREQEMNWRLSKPISPGLLGEEGIHSLDTMNWFLKAAPVSVTAYGQVMHWKDGREVADTVQTIVEYPGGLRFIYDITLGNSFDGSYEMLMGKDGTVLLRGERAWMFKEVDAPLLGWEVYARKEQIGDESGIALVADATKILALGKIPGKDGSTLDPGKNALYYAVEGFLDAIRQNKKETACGPLDGLQATVTALKANEAALSGSRIVYQKEWFDLA